MQWKHILKIVKEKYCYSKYLYSAKIFFKIKVKNSPDKEKSREFINPSLSLKEIKKKFFRILYLRDARRTEENKRGGSMK